MEYEPTPPEQDEDLEGDGTEGPGPEDDESGSDDE